MDTDTGEGRGRGRNDRQHPYQKSSNYKKGGARSVSIFNCGDATKDQLLGILRKNCGKFNFTSFKVESGGRAFVTLPTEGEANKLMKANGLHYHGNNLSIRMMKAAPEDQRESHARAPKGKPLTEQQIEAVHVFVDSHYSQDMRLNLGELRNQPELEGINTYFDNSAFTDVLFDAVARRCETVNIIAFSNNGIRSLQPFAVLNRHRNLERISFEGNLINDLRELDHLKTLPNLTELYLKGNPCANGDIDYRSEVARRFPNLKHLDSEPLEPLIKFDLPPTASGRMPVGESYFEDASLRNMAVQFISKFFDAYDGDRTVLANVYDSCISFFSVTSSIKRKAAWKGGGGGGADDGGYSTYDRNLLTVKKHGDRVELMANKNINIVTLLDQLPRTRHDPDNLVVDAFKMGGVENAITFYCIVAHGVFWEGDDKTGIKRAFDRTFTVVPAPADSATAMNGWPFLIVNDMLHVRMYQISFASTISPVGAATNPFIGSSLGAQFQGGGTGLTAAPSFGSTGNPTHDAMVNQLCTDSGIAPSDAIAVLSGHQWNYNAAVQAVQSVLSGQS